MRPGTRAHRDLFCAAFHTTHIEFDPHTISWPELDADQLAILRGVPFWPIARDTEREAGVLVSAFAGTVRDPAIRSAIALQGAEETRHAALMEAFIGRYAVDVPPALPTDLPTNIRQRFIDFGFEECLESYFAFGLFRIVRETGRFPGELLDIFDPILDEEARHITFFINWFVYGQARRGLPWSALPVRSAKASWHYARAVRGLIRSVRSGDDSGFAFTATGASSFSLDVTPRQFLSVCREENARRMARLDARLLRPSLVPNLATAAQTALRLVPERRRPPRPPRSDQPAGANSAVAAGR